MKSKIILNNNYYMSLVMALVLMISSNVVKAQSFIDGSFENTTSTGCYYGSTNLGYNSLMPSSVSYGVYEGVDIVVSGCYIPTIADGTYAVIIANEPGNTMEGEAVSLELSSPLVIGTSYDFTFQAHAITLYGPKGDLFIGASTSSTSFGTNIYTAVTFDDIWATYTFTFTATENTTHITIMPVPGVESWTAIDDFSISPSCFVSGTDVQTSCDSYTWIDGNMYNTNNNTATFNIVGGAANGCDSTVTLDLTINSSSSSSITESGLDIYTAPSGSTYNSSGIYIDVIANAAGCDSTITIDLTMDYTGLAESQLGKVKLYPNPTTDKITISISEDVLDASFRILDQSGRIVLIGKLKEISNDIDVSHFQNGLYYVFIDELVSIKFAKN